MLEYKFKKKTFIFIELNEQLTESVLVTGTRDHEDDTKQNPANVPVPSEEHVSGFVAQRGENWVSEETGALQEIADILLMMKQKNK